MPLCLPRLYDADFVLRGYPGVDGDAVQVFLKAPVVQGVQFGPGNSQVPWFKQADFLCHSRGRGFMVAGNHHRAHTGAAGVDDCRTGFNPGRVHHGGHTQEQVLPLVRLQAGLGIRDFFTCHGQYA